MKTGILNLTIRAAAVVCVPFSAWAADLTPANSGNEGGQTTGSSPLNTDPSTAGGILVHNGAAYIVHRLQSEMSLPDGSKIEPSGQIIGRDGSKRSVQSGQMLTLDGRILAAPFGAPSAEAPTGSNYSPNTSSTDASRKNADTQSAGSLNGVSGSANSAADTGATIPQINQTPQTSAPVGSTPPESSSSPGSGGENSPPSLRADDANDFSD